jgi:hypothetical protein
MFTLGAWEIEKTVRLQIPTCPRVRMNFTQ